MKSYENILVYFTCEKEMTEEKILIIGLVLVIGSDDFIGHMFLIKS